MKKLGLLGAAAFALLAATAVMAASPSPSPSHPVASPRPSASASPSHSPAASPSPSPSASPKPATANNWSATVSPVQITGTAAVQRLSSGDGTITLRVSGLTDEALGPNGETAVPWAVDVDGGTLARPNEREEIAFKAGTDVARVSTDVIRIHLTKTEMGRFVAAQKNDGVVIQVSDGTRLAVAEIKAG